MPLEFGQPPTYVVTWKRDYVDTEEKEVSRQWTPGGWELFQMLVEQCQERDVLKWDLLYDRGWKAPNTDGH